DRIGPGESGAPVKGVNSAFGKFLFPIAGHFIGEAALERDQAAPINLRVACNTMAAHAGLRVNRLSATDQHLLWIAAAQCASPAEGTVIDQRHRPPSTTHLRACRLCGGAGADDHEIVGAHNLVSSSPIPCVRAAAALAAAASSRRRSRRE